MRQYRRQAPVDGGQISLNWMFLFKWIRMVLSIPLSASFRWPFATTSLLGHLLQQTADVPVFPVCGVGRKLCYPRLTSWNISLKRIEAKQQMLAKRLTGVLPQRLHPDWVCPRCHLEAGETLKHFIQKVETQQMDGKVGEPWIIPPRQIQSCCLTGTLQVHYGYKCTVVYYKSRGRRVRQIIQYV